MTEELSSQEHSGSGASRAYYTRPLHRDQGETIESPNKTNPKTGEVTTPLTLHREP